MVYKVIYGTPDVESEATEKDVKFTLVKGENLAKIDKLATFFETEELTSTVHEGKPLLVLKRKHRINGFFYGFGDKVGPLDRKGRRYVFWNTDNFTHHPSADPLYKSIPFYVFASEDARHWYGCFTDYPGWMEIDLDPEGSRELIFKVLGNGFAQYIITGRNVKEIVRQYVNLTGQNIAFPVWAFGYQQSRWSYSTEDEVLDVARNFRERGIPCDVIYLDIDYMDDYKVFTWNPKGFKNYKQTIEELHHDGFKVVAILDPGVKVEEGYSVFEEGKNRYFLKDAKKPDQDFEGAVWPGRVRFPDFREPEVRKWWANHVRNYMEDGIDGFWNDMNEIAIFATEYDLQEAQENLEKLRLEDGIKVAGTLGAIGEIGRRGHGDDIQHLDGTPHWKVKNVYGYNMQRAVAEMLKNDGRRPFLISRSAYAGIQKFGGVWTGDNHSWWEHILQEIVRLNSLSLCGIFYSGCDIGGFGGDVNAELLVRFMQFGVFTPMFRNHSAIGTRRQEPWQFGPEVEELLKKTIKLRYELLPYIYTQYMLGVLTNIPLMRPMFYDFNSPEALRIEDQYMFGDSLLVAPVFRSNTVKRLVWFPKPARHLTIGAILRKGWNIVDTPIEHPVAFQLIDSAVPTVQAPNYVDMGKIDRVTWKVFLRNKAIGYLYEDDGTSLDYLKGIYNLKKVVVTRDRIEIQTIHSGYPSIEREWLFDIITKKGKQTTVRVVVRHDSNITVPVEW
ncbi:TIM-barrel domain-containing protein [Fervidobacterium thailandense]|uniref:Alpha-glucosidase n=1 Tax=Fervidobacterium thailandense TaxID=1008305 RepID=A0A1E3G3Y0_9BACT|nr:TIM-barrel domain-containing protein [Fervidobacterium thailandense]ODN30872.1 alpha-glucosidase [Fervidobacterium thailandense]